jgi:hypothetical protein
MAVPKEPGKSSAVRSGPVKNQKKTVIARWPNVGSSDRGIEKVVARKVPKSHPQYATPAGTPKKTGRHVTMTGRKITARKSSPKP